MNGEFIVGDVVVIKSGGPAMTVTNLDTGITNIIVCTWFIDKIVIQTRSFEKASLKRYLVSLPKRVPHPRHHVSNRQGR